MPRRATFLLCSAPCSLIQLFLPHSGFSARRCSYARCPLTLVIVNSKDFIVGKPSRRWTGNQLTLKALHSLALYSLTIHKTKRTGSCEPEIGTRPAWHRFQSAANCTLSASVSASISIRLPFVRPVCLTVTRATLL